MGAAAGTVKHPQAALEYSFLVVKVDYICQRFHRSNRKLLNISEGKAYEIIRMLNAELKEKGYIVVRGKVNTKYFFKKLIYNEE